MRDADPEHYSVHGRCLKGHNICFAGRFSARTDRPCAVYTNTVNMLSVRWLASRGGTTAPRTRTKPSVWRPQKRLTFRVNSTIAVLSVVHAITIAMFRIREHRRPVSPCGCYNGTLALHAAYNIYIYIYILRTNKRVRCFSE